MPEASEHALNARRTLAVPVPQHELGLPSQRIAFASNNRIVHCSASLVHVTTCGDCADAANTAAPSIRAHTALRSHGSRRVAAVAVYGERLASADESGSISIRPLADDACEPPESRRSVDSVHALAWAPDGAHVLAVGGLPISSGAARYVAALDASGGRVYATASSLSREDSFAGPTRPCRCVCIASCGESSGSARPKAKSVIAAVGSDDGGVYVYAGTPYAPLCASRGLHSRPALCVAFHLDDGQVYLASGGADGRVCVSAVDVAKGTMSMLASWSMDDAPSSVTGVAWRSGTRLVAVRADGSMHTLSFDASAPSLSASCSAVCKDASGNSTHAHQVLIGESGAVIVALHDGSVAAVSEDGSQSMLLAGHTRALSAWACGADGALVASGCPSGRVIDHRPASFRAFGLDVGRVISVTAEKDGTIAVAGSTASAVISGGVVCPTVLHAPNSTALVLPSGSAIWTGGEIVVTLGDCKQVFRLESCPLHADVSTTSLFSIEGDTLTHTSPGASSHLKILHSTRATSLAASPSGQFVAVADDSRRIHLVSQCPNEHAMVEVPTRWEYHAAPVHTLAWQPCTTNGTCSDANAILASGGSDGAIMLWDARKPSDGPLARVLDAHLGGVLRLSWASQNVLVSSGADGTLREWHFAM